MSRESLRIPLMVSMVIGAFIITTAGPGQTIPVTSGASQSSWSQVIAGVNDSHAQGHMMLAGPTVRDHRSCAPNCGPYNPPGYGRGGGKRGNTPPPLSPGNGEGGVTVTPSGNSRGIPCLGNLC
jgi:hypothetical protein